MSRGSTVLSAGRRLGAVTSGWHRMWVRKNSWAQWIMEFSSRRPPWSRSRARREHHQSLRPSVLRLCPTALRRHAGSRSVAFSVHLFGSLVRLLQTWYSPPHSLVVTDGRIYRVHPPAAIGKTVLGTKFLR